MDVVFYVGRLVESCFFSEGEGGGGEVEVVEEFSDVGGLGLGRGLPVRVCAIRSCSAFDIYCLNYSYEGE